MAIELTIVLSGAGGVLDRAELKYPQEISPFSAQMQQDICRVIANWELRPGDTIEILGNEEAFDKL